MTQDVSETSEVNRDIREVDYGKRKLRIIVLLLVYAAVLGVVVCSVSDQEDRSRDFLLGLPMLILGIAWCHSDARQRNHRIGGLTSALLVLIFIVGLPVYMFQTRGIRGFLAILVAVCIVIAMFVCMLATGFVTLWLRGELG